MTYLGNLDAEPLAEDKWERLDQWMFNIDDPITARYLQRYAVAAIARVFDPGSSSGNCRCCLDRRG